MRQIFTAVLLFLTNFLFAQSTTVVISQVYGGGGSTTGTYNADYVELHNISTVSQDISGHVLMYGSATGSLATSTGNSFTFPASTSIPAGGYLLVATIAGTGLANLPITADQTFTLTISGTNGKVAYGTSAMLPNTPVASQPAGSIIDMVGYGTSNAFEGTVLAALSATTAALRNNNGCSETNNNLADFTIGTPSPRNGASPANICGGASSPVLTASTLTAFGTLCVNATSAANSFTLNGTNLTAGDITVGPLSGYSFSSTATGTYSSTLTIAQTGGTLSATTIFVQFTPTAVQTYDGNITVGGGGATAIQVAASGAGVTTVSVTATTGAASAISPTTATLAGNISLTCATASAYGMEYSTTSGFTPGAGTIVNGTNLTSNAYTVNVSGLAAATTYFYVAFVTTSGGTVYGTESSFTTVASPTPGGVVISQVYGGGGNAIATYNADYVELHNNGTASQDISGHIIMYGSTSGNLGSVATNIFTFPTGTSIPAGGYLLIAQVAGTGIANLPVTADHTFTANLSATNGKIIFGTSALTANATLAAQAAGSVLDFVGYGTANESEGSAVGALTVTTAAIRNNNGCDDTNNNLADFTLDVPLPRNSASPVFICGSSATPTLTSGSLTAFGSTCVNNMSAPNSFTVSGTDLTAADIVVGPLDGFLFSSTASGTYSATLNISHAAGTLSPTDVFVKFAPSLVQTYSGNIPVSGGGASAIQVAASGSVTAATTPSFTQIPAICAGGNVVLSSTSTEGITGTWSPAINNAVTTTYTFTPDAGQCATTSTLIVNVTQPTIPVFTQVSAICVGGSFSLSNTSSNAITGTWTPAIDNSTTTIYTFTPDAGQCATITTMTVTVNTPGVIPTFNQQSDICTGVSFNLPTTSINNITGNWSPAIDNANTTTYTFTPDDGQCALPATMTVNVITPTAPTFSPIASICEGEVLTLPSNSINGITGTWLPAVNNTTTTTYTFTPDAGQCATTATMTVTVNSAVTPIFTQVNEICSGASFTLPTTSNNSIIGTWSPAINNTATTTYTFTPDAGQCAGLTTMTVAVSPSSIPDFTQIPDICNGGTISLPTTSNNSIVGTWSPAVNNTVTTTYTFTPDAGQCATPTTMTVSVITSGTASATTGAAASVTTNSATLAGTITLTCATATAYGVEYSTTNGFTPGTGTVSNGTNLSGSGYTVTLSGLTASTTYYYVAFVTTTAGTVYGSQSTFTTTGSITTGPAIVISQVYGGGGNTGATFNADFVELHNRTSATQSLAGMSVQYASATSTTTWSGVITLPSASIPAGGYYLVQTTTPGTTGAALPAADHTPTVAVNMSGTNGKVALVNGTTALAGCPTTGQYVDMVGYGTANCSETTAMPALSATLAAFRNNNGCDDTDNNSADFSTGVPTPRNSSSAAVVCGSSPTGAVLNASNLPNFGSVILTTTFTQSFTLTGSNLTGAPGNITLSSSNPVYLLSTDNINWSATITVPFTSAVLSSTTIFVQFAPVTTGVASSTISVSGGGANNISVTATGTGMNIPVTPILTVSPGQLSFGSVCAFNSVGPQTFTITGTNLTADPVLVNTMNGYTYSTNPDGPFTPGLSITHAPGAFSQVVYVLFTPNAEAIFDNSISTSGGGAGAVFVAVTGAGTKSTPDVETGDSLDITINSVKLSGLITAEGCTDVTEYGVEVSGITGFINGTGIRYPASNLNNGIFQSSVTGLVQNTAYYYKAYAKNNGGYAYGPEKLFVTKPIFAGLNFYSMPFIRGQKVHFSISGIKPGHYTVKIFNSGGQVAFKYELIAPVGIIDEEFVLPATLTPGVYSFQVATPEFRIVKPVLVQ